MPSTPVVARRRMTTPVVAPRSGFYPPNLRGVGGTLEVKKNDVIPEFSFRASGRKMSGISAARRGVPLELRLRCREATAREGWRWRSSRGILSHPLLWRHACLIVLAVKPSPLQPRSGKRNNAPHKTKKQTSLVLPVHRRYAVCGRSSVQCMLPQPASGQTQQRPTLLDPDFHRAFPSSFSISARRLAGMRMTKSPLSSASCRALSSTVAPATAP